MPPYVRPALPNQVFHDAGGNVIDYGNRWRDRPGRMPPDDLYEVISNPQRFAGFHTLADALVEHLRANYDVSVTEDAAFSADLMSAHEDVARAVRVVPESPDGAPLTFVYTEYPSLILHAGLLHDFPFPTCGCDACDETVEALADDLEDTVLAVVAGQFAETVSPSSSPPFDIEVGYELRRRGLPFWKRGGHGAYANSSRVKAVEARLRDLPNGWQPWRPSS